MNSSPTKNLTLEKIEEIFTELNEKELMWLFNGTITDSIREKLSRKKLEIAIDHKISIINRKNSALQKRQKEIEDDRKKADLNSSTVMMNEVKEYEFRGTFDRPLPEFDQSKSSTEEEEEEEEEEEKKKYKPPCSESQMLRWEDLPPPDPVSSLLSDPSRDYESQIKRNGNHRGRGGYSQYKNGGYSQNQRGAYRQYKNGGYSQNQRGAYRQNQRGGSHNNGHCRNHEYNEWKLQQTKYDEDRIKKSMNGDGDWRREWDRDKTDYPVMCTSLVNTNKNHNKYQTNLYSHEERHRQHSSKLRNDNHYNQWKPRSSEDKNRFSNAPNSIIHNRQYHKNYSYESQRNVHSPEELNTQYRKSTTRTYRNHYSNDDRFSDDDTYKKSTTNKHINQYSHDERSSDDEKLKFNKTPPKSILRKTSKYDHNYLHNSTQISNVCTDDEIDGKICADNKQLNEQEINSGDSFYSVKDYQNTNGICNSFSEDKIDVTENDSSIGNQNDNIYKSFSDSIKSDSTELNRIEAEKTKLRESVPPVPKLDSDDWCKISDAELEARPKNCQNTNDICTSYLEHKIKVTESELRIAENQNDNNINKIFSDSVLYESSDRTDMSEPCSSPAKSYGSPNSPEESSDDSSNSKRNKMPIEEFVKIVKQVKNSKPTQSPLVPPKGTYDEYLEKMVDWYFDDPNYFKDRNIDHLTDKIEARKKKLQESVLPAPTLDSNDRCNFSDAEVKARSKNQNKESHENVVVPDKTCDCEQKQNNELSEPAEI